ncbi:precorrin-8X methylmutase [Dongia soli]|uniref:Precorrin-8X methylmutase n=1 Tax=Dongia soli TaxID=600628 RepID=A0ABU5ECD3_9PROT|nr:precorrin-8X methylmutase [Dongia soli]MDY0883868.1 precorrin-8X methylmutase [Dongia soli]
MAFVYERDPQAIYRQSYATIEAEADLAALPQTLRPVAIRMIHACGMTDLPGNMAWRGDPIGAARQALAAGATILCDAQMVASGIIKRFFPSTDIRCDINAPGLADLAVKLGTTRSAAAVEMWRDVLAGSVAVIGNAPTALFHLIEMIESGGPKPAAIFGFPVGFVGAAESKDALIAADLGVPCLTLSGRRGGSAIAAAAINALSSEELRGNL